MPDVIRMLRYPRMIKCMAFTAAVFALLSVVFKNGIVIIPEVTEIRLCNIIALPMGLFFGPAGALGCAVGNLIGDLGGSLSLATCYGFVANFLSAYLPYKIWRSFDGSAGDGAARPSLKARLWGLRLLLGGTASVCSCVIVLAFCLDVMSITPAANGFLIVALNNAAATVAGALLFIAMSFIPKTLLPYCFDEMTREKSLRYTRADRVIILAITSLCFVMAAMFTAYIFVNGLSITVADDYGNMFLLAASGAVSVLSAVLPLLTGIHGIRFDKEGKM